MIGTGIETEVLIGNVTAIVREEEKDLIEIVIVVELGVVVVLETEIESAIGNVNEIG
jgi:hypothetical protein